MPADELHANLSRF